MCHIIKIFIILKRAGSHTGKTLSTRSRSYHGCSQPPTPPPPLEFVCPPPSRGVGGLDIEEEKALFWHWIVVVPIFNNKKGSPDKVSSGEGYKKHFTNKLRWMINVPT